MYDLYFTKQAQKDAKKIKNAGLKDKAQHLLEVIKTDPFKEKLVGDLLGAYSRRINIQHRLIYQVDEPLKAIKIIRLWTHYE